MKAFTIVVVGTAVLLFSIGWTSVDVSHSTPALDVDQTTLVPQLGAKAKKIFEITVYGARYSDEQTVVQTHVGKGTVNFTYYSEMVLSDGEEKTTSTVLGQRCKVWRQSSYRCDEDECDTKRAHRRAKKFAKRLRKHLRSCKTTLNHLTYSGGFEPKKGR